MRGIYVPLSSSGESPLERPTKKKFDFLSDKRINRDKMRIKSLEVREKEFHKKFHVILQFQYNSWPFDRLIVASIINKDIIIITI